VSTLKLSQPGLLKIFTEAAALAASMVAMILEAKKFIKNSFLHEHIYSLFINLKNH